MNTSLDLFVVIIYLYSIMAIRWIKYDPQQALASFYNNFGMTCNNEKKLFTANLFISNFNLLRKFLSFLLNAKIYNALLME